MPVEFTCECGKRLRIKDELAGKKVRCSACLAVSTVPAPPPDRGDEEDLDSRDERPPEPRPGRTATRATAPEPKPDPSDDDDEDAPARPKSKSRRKRDNGRTASEEGWFGGMNAGGQEEHDEQARKTRHDANPHGGKRERLDYL